MEERPPMSGEEEAAGVSIAPPRRRNPWLVLALLALPFILGIAATVLALPYLDRWRDDPAAEPPRRAVPAGPPPAPQPLRPLTADRATMLDDRVAQLEERLNRITVEAQAASGNAARAEGLLVAFAARRALDSGTPLGYVEGQLRLRFGQGQPRAVATIINAAREPITLADLRAGLLDISHRVMTPPPDSSWWRALEHEARALVTIRKASTPSPQPRAAFDRALHYIDSGRVAAALAQVEQMPGQTAAERWMQLARRYIEARRALDLIETAAILEPRQLRAADGVSVSQTSPLAP
ncbi:MAG: hypothetical protein AB7E60_04115 [Sphingobium sp.]